MGECECVEYVCRHTETLAHKHFNTDSVQNVCLLAVRKKVKTLRTTNNRISVYMATGIIVFMSVPANVEHRFQQKSRDCARAVVAVIQGQYFICL